MKLLPDTLWSLSACELVDMYEAFISASDEAFDIEMQRTSWFTALIMNSSGNFKKPIKPEKLYEPLEKRSQKSDTDKSVEYVKLQQEELKKKFNIQ